ncbi:putative nudix hydrolase 6 [Stomoxys calcitrans]|uniref:putative nudix hydrolase 6 n=1 Tax=Stomoxys calcitrans TaxID=35570 RepID=UPI0027E3435B|nr:putative nudix hydrolase 6 [Stomoxys calcitrans]
MSKSPLIATMIRHTTCRNNVYPRSDVKRFSVPDEKLPWSVIYTGYEPPSYTAPHINGQIWADPDLQNAEFKPQWNALDGKINRVSYNGEYKLDEGGHPLNPMGRTGLRGRGLLGRWGPNHAADPIVTRWKRDSQGNILKSQITSKNILQMVAIQRHDNKMWAIPGGMVDPGEKVNATLRREFMEEALDSFKDKDMVEDFFATGTEVYKGYVDDYRNTDNAWIETVAYNYHDESGEQVGKLELSAGDDAAGVQWMDVDSGKQLHANHSFIVQKVVELLNAHW